LSRVSSECSLDFSNEEMKDIIEITVDGGGFATISVTSTDPANVFNIIGSILNCLPQALISKIPDVPAFTVFEEPKEPVKIEKPIFG